jgi:hypothetical protein
MEYTYNYTYQYNYTNDFNYTYSLNYTYAYNYTYNTTTNNTYNYTYAYNYSYVLNNTYNLTYNYTDMVNLTYNYTYEYTYNYSDIDENVYNTIYAESLSCSVEGCINLSGLNFPVNIRITTKTEYEYGGLGRIEIYAYDLSDFPITGGSGTVLINYPNLTVWTMGNLSEIADGIITLSLRHR